MRLSKKFDYALIVLAILSFGTVFAVLTHFCLKNTFADSEDTDTFVSLGDHFVTVYDAGEKLTIKTDAHTVADALSRAGILVNATDTIEPALDTIIDMDDFHINIYRSYPVILVDGAKQIYTMTSSYEPRTIMTEAGIAVYDGDEIIPFVSNTFLEAGVATAYKIIRNGGRTITVEQEIAFPEQTIKDYNLAPGTAEVRQLGEIGSKTLTYNVLYQGGQEISRTLVSETITKAPVARIVAVGASQIERKPLTAAMGRNRYTITKADGTIIERQETYYDLPMSRVMQYRLKDGCGNGQYSVRADGVKVDHEGYVLVAAELSRYPLCSVVETSLGLGKVYDTGSFALTNPEQFDIATDWTNRNGI